MAKKRKERSNSTALIIDGAYARIQAREMGGKVDFASLRTELEHLVGTEFEECWYFDSQRFDARGNSPLAIEYNALKYARPTGPQFQVRVFSTKKYNCHCRKCGNRFTQNIQKGVDNAIATKLLTLTTQDHIDRLVLFSGDGDFYTSLGFVRNELRKEVWVVGFLGTVSGDLQQLSTRLVWVNDIWERVKHQARRDGGRPPPFGSRYGASGLMHQSQRRPQRHRHSRPSRRWRECESSDDEKDSLDPYGPSRHRARVLSPPREASPINSHRMHSSFQGDGAEFDEVNLSGSEDEDTLSSSPLSEEDAGSANAEVQAVGDSTGSISCARPPEQFPLPMAVPITVTPPTSTSRNNRTRPRPLFDWAFGESA